jgi:hypothetical protein
MQASKKSMVRFLGSTRANFSLKRIQAIVTGKITPQPLIFHEFLEVIPLLPLGVGE